MDVLCVLDPDADLTTSTGDSSTALETEIDFLERLLREPGLRRRFSANPTLVANECGAYLSPAAELALMEGLSEAISFADPKRASGSLSGTHPRALRNPYGAPTGGRNSLLTANTETCLCTINTIAASSIVAIGATKPK